MQFPKTIKLILAAAMVLALIAILGITMNTGTTATKAPIIRKLLRRYDKTKGPPTAAEVAELKKQEQRNERELEDGIPKHVPIKVKIKTEKQDGFKDLENGRWLRDLEIEVTNLGTKPIYFLDLRLMLPDTKGPDGNVIGWVLFYGRTDLVSVTEPLKATDVPIQPKESHIFTIANRFVSAWEDLVREGLVTQPKRVQVLFQLVNFGDGTGYWGGSAAPLPHPKKRLAAGPCVDAKPDKRGSPPKTLFASSSADRTSSLFKGLPAFVPANFLLSESPNAITVDAGGSAPDVCCPGTSCTWAKQAFTRCQCSSIENPEINDAPSVSFPGCSDASGACSTITWSTRWCNFPMGEGRTVRLSCSDAFVFPCFDDAPPPPPMPSPAPPSPTPTPTPTPACPTPTPTPVCLPGETPLWHPYPDCYWTCSLSDPPDGGGGGGGGADPNPNPVMTRRECVNYYWVHFTSYDGGQTWNYADNETYAGCFYMD